MSSKNIERKHPEGLKTNLAAVVKRRRSMRGWPLRQKDGQSIWEDLARLTSSLQNTPPTKIANTSSVHKKADKKGSDLEIRTETLDAKYFFLISVPLIFLKLKLIVCKIIIRWRYVLFP